jgi:hypothetical protein
MTPSDFNWHSYEWRMIQERLVQQRTDLIERLIRIDDAEVRGKIKQIDEVLSWNKETPITTGITTY